FRLPLRHPDMLSFWAESESAGDSPALSNALQPLMSVCCRRCKTRTLGQQKNVSLTAPHQTLRESQKPTTTVYSNRLPPRLRPVPLGAHAFILIYQYSGSSLGTFRVSQVKDGSLWPRKKIFEISPFHRARSESAGLTLKISGKRLRRALTTSMPNQASTSSCAYFIRCSRCF